MKSQDIKNKFIEFFKRRGHVEIPSASLVPENDPSVLFTTAGMQPLVPYLRGEPHPAGRRLVNVQRCVRTTDIDKVGDASHLTFFEMLGNWSLGDYFKKEAIEWSYEFLTSKDEGLGLDPNKLHITYFKDDDESPKVWRSLGIPEDRISAKGEEDNFWSPGENGPCGPDTEMFYETPSGLVEIWNDVFIEYEKRDGKVVGKLAQKNVDTGAGLERIAAVLQNKDNVFDTDIFSPIMSKLPAGDERARRIVADHVRAAGEIIKDGVVPSNTDRGYVLRRLIRRAVVYADKIGIGRGTLFEGKTEQEEENKFRIALDRGLREIKKGERDAFLLNTTFGLPLEVLKEYIPVDEEKVKEEIGKHKQLSRLGSEKKFKGGLADHSEMSTKYHTATHMMYRALRAVLGEHVVQRGSNITPERLRFDFSHGAKMTPDQLAEVERIVNEKIREDLSVTYSVMPTDEALKSGALGAFGDKYGPEVKVYEIAGYSREICGGPHVEQTGILGTFKIIKEESVAAGIRRIKAVLQ